MTIEEIIRQVREETLPPGKLADYRLRIAGEYGLLSERMSIILKERPSIWLEIRQREEIKSDKMADRIWDATEMGQEEAMIRFKLKAYDKLMSGISSRLRIYEEEAKHHF